MTVEIIDQFIVNEITQGKLPPYWDDKAVVQGLYKAVNASLQRYFDTVKDWVDGITISNAIGNNLDDIGYKYNIVRQGLNDDEYRLAILLKMSAYSDSGTTTDVIRFIRSSFLAAFADITQYPDTRFGTCRVEGALITTDRAANINAKVTSGSRLEVTWDYVANGFVPSCLVPSAPLQDLLATLPSGTDTIGATLDGGMFDTLGYVVEDTKTIYPAGLERSVLLSGGVDFLDVVTDHEGNTIELVTDAGVFPVEVLSSSIYGRLEVLKDTFGDPIQLITDSGTIPLEVVLLQNLGGRYLSSLPVVKQ